MDKKRLWIVFALLMLCCGIGAAEEKETAYPIAVWTVRETDMYEKPDAEAARCGLL